MIIIWRASAASAVADNFGTSEIQHPGENYKWGFQIGDYDQPHQWFKLGLDPAHRSGVSSSRFKRVSAGIYTQPRELSNELSHNPQKNTELILRLKLSEIHVIRGKISHGLIRLSIQSEWDNWFPERMKREREEDEGGGGSKEGAIDLDQLRVNAFGSLLYSFFTRTKSRSRIKTCTFFSTISSMTLTPPAPRRYRQSNLDQISYVGSGVDMD